MTLAAADAHAQANSLVASMMAAAMRADIAAISAVVGGAGGGAGLDAHTAEFLRRARTGILGVCAALSGVLQTHRLVTNAYGTPVCANCGTVEACQTLQRINTSLLAYRTCGVGEIGRAEAWRRADSWLNRDAARPLLIAIEEIPDGFVTWPLPQPSPAGDRTLLVVDKRSGRMTRWPPLSKGVLALQYRNYLDGRPVRLGPSNDHP